jgi:TRAP-type uncharacterized transport system fused permease subunit
MGVPLLAAHLAVFWFSQSSNVTPPVCMAAFAGASIAQANPYSTGFQAMRFSSFLYIMPFMFVYTPILMLNGFDWNVAYTWLVMFSAAVPFAAGVSGYCFGHLNLVSRILLIVGAVMLVFPNRTVDLPALALLVGVVLYHYWRARRQTDAQTATNVSSS